MIHHSSRPSCGHEVETVPVQSRNRVYYVFECVLLGAKTRIYASFGGPNDTCDFITFGRDEAYSQTDQMKMVLNETQMNGESWNQQPNGVWLTEDHKFAAAVQDNRSGQFHLDETFEDGGARFSMVC